MSQLNNVSNKGNGRGGQANGDYVSKYAIFFLEGFPNLFTEVILKSVLQYKINFETV